MDDITRLIEEAERREKTASIKENGVSSHSKAGFTKSSGERIVPDPEYKQYWEGKKYPLIGIEEAEEPIRFEKLRKEMKPTYVPRRGRGLSFSRPVIVFPED